MVSSPDARWRRTSGDVRFDKIQRIVAECKFGVHDISRTELDQEHQLPRFNMPLELGVFIGARRFGNTQQKNKNYACAEVSRYEKGPASSQNWYGFSVCVEECSKVRIPAKLNTDSGSS